MLSVFTIIKKKNGLINIRKSYNIQMFIKIVERRMEMKSRISTQNLVTMALFTALLCILAYISIPLSFPGSTHITMLNFGVLLVALLFPVYQSFLIVFVWMLAGLLGLPVFVAGASTFAYLANPWGGYTIAFLVMAIVLPLLQRKKYHRIYVTVLAIIGMLLNNGIGMIWLKLFSGSGMSWQAAFLTGFLPFLPLDIIKAVGAAQIIPTLRKILLAGERH